MVRDLDLLRFARGLVPPVLRRKNILALIKVLVAPIVYVYSQYRAYGLNADVVSNVTPQAAAMLQRIIMLGEEYTAVRIINTEYTELSSEYMFLAEEQQPRYLWFSNESQDAKFRPWYCRMSNESIFGANFVVQIPKKYQFMSDVPANVKAIVDRYKAAGRTYKIEYYENKIEYY